MTLIEVCVAYLLAGWALGLVLYLLGIAIDQQRGALAEVAAVTLPLCIAAVIYTVSERIANLAMLGTRLAPLIQFVVVALTIFVAVRWAERTWAAETTKIADLFRITTVVSLSTVVLTSLLDPVNAINIALITFIFIAADRATQSSRAVRNVAIVFSLGFVTCIVCQIWGMRSVLELADSHLRLLNSNRWRTSMRDSHGGMALLALVGAITSTPHFMRRLWLTSRWLHELTLQASVWKFSLGAPADMIFVRPLFDLWHFRSGVCFLNHGSFGAVPLVLRDVQQQLREKCADEPMDFLVRQLEPGWLDSRFALATWLGTKAENIAFCENATAGMNEIAHWFPLQAGDEVLLNDHEYGAVRRIWQRTCGSSGASLVTATLPLALESPQQITDAILSRVTERTRLVVVSHITSPTALRLPVEEICRRLRGPDFSDDNVAVCIDGPHALLQEPLRLYQLGCDFYTASCHKWLCAPLGSGFVYVDPKWHDQMRPLRLSWGRLQPAEPKHWTDELLWSGTRDYSAYLSVSKAIRFFANFDYESLDARNHSLACYARRRLSSLSGASPVTPEGREWFGWMVAVWLPDGDHSTLQQRLFSNHKIEVPIVHFANRYLVRVSCHLYNSTHDIDILLRALEREIVEAV